MFTAAFETSPICWDTSTNVATDPTDFTGTGTKKDHSGRQDHHFWTSTSRHNSKWDAMIRNQMIPLSRARNRNANRTSECISKPPSKSAFHQAYASAPCPKVPEVRLREGVCSIPSPQQWRRSLALEVDRVPTAAVEEC